MVPFLGANKSPTAVLMNRLFAQVERAMDAACDGKSLFCSIGAGAYAAAVPGHPGIVGKIFCFTNGTRVWSAGLPANYNHATYTAAAAAAVEVSRDTTKRIMTCSGLSSGPIPSVLEDSLEAHTRTDGDVEFYLLADLYTIPEKHYRFAVAELVYEGSGYESVTFPEEYDKYQFFRIHNLNAYAMSFQFVGGPTYTIPRWGQIAVRRTRENGPTPAGDYVSGWKYCWKFEAGDPRFFCHLAEDAGLYATMSANNVTNPAILYRWIDEFEIRARQGVPGAWYTDKHSVYDMQALYVPTHYPSPSDTAQIFGNFFHHRGDFQVSGTTYTFSGYESLPAVLSAAVSGSGDNLQVNPGAAITAISTNLFGALSVASFPHSLESNNSGRTNLLVISEEEEGYTILDATAGTLATIGREVLNVKANIAGAESGGTLLFSHAGSSGLANIHFWEDTLAEVLTLNDFGYAGATGTEQNTNATTIAERELVLTPFGPRIHFLEEIEISGSLHWGTGSPLGSGYKLLEDPMHEVSGGTIRRKGFVQFAGYGFPVPVFHDVTLPLSYESNPSFLTPREFSRKMPAPWIYSTYGSEHPNFADALAGTDGADFELTATRENHTIVQAGSSPDGPQDVALMWHPSLVSSGGVFKAWAITGVPEMPRVPLLREHYNALAAAINSVKRARPVDFSIYFIDLGGGTLVNFTPNNSGIFGSEVCPREMYCSFASGSNGEAAATALGLTIYDDGDLPADYASALAETCDLKRWRYRAKDVVTSAAEPLVDHSYVDTAVTTTASGIPVHKAAGYDPGLPPHVPPSVILGDNFSDVLGFTPTHGNTDFFWVKIAEVKTKAEALGWKFLYRGAFQLLALEVFDAANPAEVHAPEGGTVSRTEPGLGGASVGEEYYWAQDVYFKPRRPAFVDAEDGDWKIARDPLQLVSLSPGDTYIFGIPDRYFLSTAYYRLGIDEAWRLAYASTNHPDLHAPSLGAGARKYGLLQLYYSSGISNESVAFKIPVTHGRHAQDDFSEISLSNAESIHPPTYSGIGPSYSPGVASGSLGSIGGPVVQNIAVQEQTRGGSIATSQAIGSGETVISFEPLELIEVAPYWRALVQLF